MVYLVTGGAGFIGSHLCEALLAAGGRVLAVDNLSTGSYHNIEPLKANPRFSFFAEDVRDRDLMAELVRQADRIFHLAAAVGVRLVIDQPVETLEANILGAHTVLSLAARYNRPILIASTSEVYGKSPRQEFSEDDDLILGPSSRNRWGYACSKLADEFLALAYHLQKGVPVVVVRLFNTVGPRQTGRYGMVIPTFVGQALRGEPITVYGSGRQTRCFVHVSEVIEALGRLVREDRALGQVFNLGSTDEISILELAQTVREVTGSTSDIIHVPYSEAYHAGYEDMPHRVPDISKIKALIGFSPRISLRRIIADTAAWMAAAHGQSFHPGPQAAVSSRTNPALQTELGDASPVLPSPAWHMAPK